MSQATKDRLITVAWGADVIAAIIMFIQALRTFRVLFIVLAAVLAIIGKLVAPMVPIPESAQARGYTHEYFSGKQRRPTPSEDSAGGEPAALEAGSPMPGDGEA